MKVCGAQWQAAKAAGTTNGLTWPQFLAQCREQQKSVGMGGGGPPAPEAPPPSMHNREPPTQTGAAPAPVPAPSSYTTTATPTGAGEFASEQQARSRCPSDTIVWVNNLSHVYHYNVVSSHGRSFFGRAKDGAYMCEADARAAGDRAAKDERQSSGSAPSRSMSQKGGKRS
jgi:hypothetical protein